MVKKINSQETERFYEAVLSLKTKEECEKFFADICTVTELSSISQRLEVAVLLQDKKTFNEIVAHTGASTTTISRVNRCLQYGDGGYEIVLERIKK
jgi:TrpR-related protein YerC/YecD